jgi:uncharacterized membrane protein
MTFLWFLCAATPPLLHALSAIMDQYVIREHASGSPLLFLSFSGFVCIPVAIVLAFITPMASNLDVTTVFWIILSGWLFSACCIPYVYAMEDADAHEFTPVFQSAPIFVALFSWLFWGEVLTPTQLLGGLVVILAAASSMTDWRALTFKARPFFLILLAMVFYALFVACLRSVAIELSWLQITFWLCMSWSLLPFILMAFFPSVRRLVVKRLIDTRGRIILYASGQEIADVGANAARAAALGFAAVPAAVTDLVGGLQVIFALFFGFLAARMIPTLYTFTLTRRELLYKICCFVALMGGLALVVR